MSTVAALLFWICSALIVYTHVGYPLVLMALVRLRGRPVGERTGIAAPAAGADPHLALSDPSERSRCRLSP